MRLSQLLDPVALMATIATKTRYGRKPGPEPWHYTKQLLASYGRPEDADKVVDAFSTVGISDEVDAGKRAGQHLRRLEAGTGRRCKDGAVDVGVAKPHGQRKLCTRRNTAYRGSVHRKRDVKARARPLAGAPGHARADGGHRFEVSSLRSSPWGLLRLRRRRGMRDGARCALAKESG